MSSSDQTYAQAKCEKCGSVFQLIADRIKPEGSQVKCGKCGHSFLFLLPDHLKGNVTNPHAKLPQSAWTGRESDTKKKPAIGAGKEDSKTISGLKLLNQSPKAKKTRRIAYASSVFAGVLLGLSTQLKGVSPKDIMFALRYGIVPSKVGLQVVELQGEHTVLQPSLHVLKINGKVFNHKSASSDGKNLVLTVLNQKGEFIKKFPVQCCEPKEISPNELATFQANVSIELTGSIGSYSVTEDTNATQAPAAN